MTKILKKCWQCLGKGKTKFHKICPTCKGKGALEDR